MSAISPVGSVIASPANVAATKAKEDVKRVAREFEGMLVRQLVSAAKVGGKNSESGYGAMAVDALASGVMDGGGLGLARKLEDALSGALAKHKVG